MKLTIIGCGDAFGSGGRFHSSYLLETSKGRLLLDCGANSPLALKRSGLTVASIDAVVISHCHGDHFGGLPFLFLDKLFMERGSKPLEILGPPGIAARTEALLECLYPAIKDLPRTFELVFHELPPESNPYFVAKLGFQTLQILVQEFEIETARKWGSQLSFCLNNMGLATYAKLGGTPWLLKANWGREPYFMCICRKPRSKSVLRMGHRSW